MRCKKGRFCSYEKDYHMFWDIFIKGCKYEHKKYWVRRLKHDHWQVIAFPGISDIAWRDQLELKSEICYFELTGQLASLFYKEGLMSTPNKPTAADAIWEMNGKQMPALLTDNVLYVLNGRNLFSKLSW